MHSQKYGGGGGGGGSWRAPPFLQWSIILRLSILTNAGVHGLHVPIKRDHVIIASARINYFTGYIADMKVAGCNELKINSIERTGSWMTCIHNYEHDASVIPFYL